MDGWRGAPGAVAGKFQFERTSGYEEKNLILDFIL